MCMQCPHCGNKKGIQEKSYVAHYEEVSEWKAKGDFWMPLEYSGGSDVEWGDQISSISEPLWCPECKNHFQYQLVKKEEDEDEEEKEVVDDSP